MKAVFGFGYLVLLGVATARAPAGARLFLGEMDGADQQARAEAQDLHATRPLRGNAPHLTGNVSLPDHPV